jgi:hypothetical protein
MHGRGPGHRTIWDWSFCVWEIASCLKTGQGASRQEREFSFLSAGSGWAWENSGEITRVDLRAFRVESRAPTQRLQLL